MIKAIWFCSWYPNEEDPFRGDFIQRQAQAVSLFAMVDVFHVVESYQAREDLLSSEINEQFREHIQYMPCKQNDRRIKPPRILRYFKAHQHFLKNYIEQYGKPDLIHVQVPMKAGLVAWFMKKRLNIPYIVTEHYGIYSQQVEDHFLNRSFLFRFLTRLVIQEAKFLTTVSFSLGKEINDVGIRKRFKVVPNVVDITLFNPSISPSPPIFRFVHISNMVPVKNVRGILQATKQLADLRQDFEIHFIGAEPDEYVSLAEDLGLLNQRVFFRREIPYFEVAEEIRRSNALIIFSDSESQSCVAIEALCSGKPVIVTQTGGVKELVDERNGFVVKPGDEKALSKAMDKMINQYGSFQQEEIAAKAAARYSYQAVGKKFMNIYEKICGRRNNISGSEGEHVESSMEEE